MMPSTLADAFYTTTAQPSTTVVSESPRHQPHQQRQQQGHVAVLSPMLQPRGIDAPTAPTQGPPPVGPFDQLSFFNRSPSSARSELNSSAPYYSQTSRTTPQQQYAHYNRGPRRNQHEGAARPHDASKLWVNPTVTPPAVAVPSGRAQLRSPPSLGPHWIPQVVSPPLDVPPCMFVDGTPSSTHPRLAMPPAVPAVLPEFSKLAAVRTDGHSQARDATPSVNLSSSHEQPLQPRWISSVPASSFLNVSTNNNNGLTGRMSSVPSNASLSSAISAFGGVEAAAHAAPPLMQGTHSSHNVNPPQPSAVTSPTLPTLHQDGLGRHYCFVPPPIGLPPSSSPEIASAAPAMLMTTPDLFTPDAAVVMQPVWGPLVFSPSSVVSTTTGWLIPLAAVHTLLSPEQNPPSNTLAAFGCISRAVTTDDATSDDIIHFVASPQDTNAMTERFSTDVVVATEAGASSPQEGNPPPRVNYGGLDGDAEQGGVGRLLLSTLCKARSDEAAAMTFGAMDEIRQRKIMSWLRSEASTGLVLDLCFQQRGRVVHCLVERFGPHRCQFVFDAIAAAFATMAVHASGSVALTRLISATAKFHSATTTTAMHQQQLQQYQPLSSLPSPLDALFSQCVSHLERIITHPCGNFVVTGFIVSCARDDYVARIAQRLGDDPLLAMRAATNKHGAFVIDALLKNGSFTALVPLYHALFHSSRDRLTAMCKDECAHYTIQAGIASLSRHLIALRHEPTVTTTGGHPPLVLASQRARITSEALRCASEAMRAGAPSPHSNTIGKCLEYLGQQLGMAE